MLYDDIFYVVKFENGRYFHSFSSERETDELRYANKYSFDWQPQKDLYLQLYIQETKKKYELVKVKTFYEVING